MASRRGIGLIRPVINSQVATTVSFNRGAVAFSRAIHSRRSPSSSTSSQTDRRVRSTFQQLQLRSASTQQSAPVEKTALYDLNASYGAKFVPFAGYSMPVQYSDLSVGESHKWTREKASIFDVSHMVQNRIFGPNVIDFLQTITPSSLSSLKPLQSTLSAFLKRTDAPGGIVDDTVIVRIKEDEFYFVTNAACREKDAAYLSAELAEFQKKHGSAPTWEVFEGRGLIALQGPLAAEILESAAADPAEVDVKTIFFGGSRYLKLKLPGGKTSSELFVSRAGYTGEDGFEISIPAEEAAAVTQSLLDIAGKDKLRLAGLGARDSLRLEAGMCLYGHDMDENITPPEAALGWIVGKDRRSATKSEDGAFHGAEVVNAQLLGKAKGGIAIEKRRVGFIVDGAIAREGAAIFDSEGNQVGSITSGCPSPTLGKNIAMGYIKSGLHKAGTEVQIEVRKKLRPAVVSKMPFVPSKYYKGP